MTSQLPENATNGRSDVGEGNVSASLDRALFVPSLLLAGMVVVLAGSASLSIPIHRVAGPLECLLALGLAVVVLRWRQPRTTRRLAGLALLAGLAAWLTLADFAGSFTPAAGDVLSLHPDNWSYQAFSDYLDRYPRGSDADLPMIDEFGASLAYTRFGTAGLLAFLGDVPLFHDVATVHLVLLTVCLVTHFFAMLALGRALSGRAGWQMPILAAVLSTAGGWLCDAVAVANNDNLLFLAMCPALLAFICPAGRPPVLRWRTVLGSALLLSALLYNYAEGVALLGVLASPLAVVLFWPFGDRRAAAVRWGELVLAGLLGLVLTLPYLGTFFRFLQSQISVSGIPVGTRPGEGFFAGLAGGRLLPASFALGEELPGTTLHWANYLLAFCLLVLVGAGAVALHRRQRWFPWVAIPFAGLFVWENAFKHYDYATYKMLICSTWWTYPAISAGLFWIADRLAWRGAIRFVPVALLLGSVGWEKYEDRQMRPALKTDARLREWHDLRTVHFVTGGAPILLALDDEQDHLWAAYYLRDTPLNTWRQKGYLAMPHIAPFLARGHLPDPASCSYVLVPGQAGDALWHNTRFSVVRRQPTYLTAVENPGNGIESIDNQRYLWLGTKPATFRIIAGEAGDYLLAANVFGIGPSAPDRNVITVEVENGTQTYTAEVRPGTRGLPIHLVKGPNELRVRCLGTPETGPHNGDPRELMLAIKGPFLTKPTPTTP